MADPIAPAKAPRRGSAHTMPYDLWSQMQSPIPPSSEWEIAPAMKAILLTTTNEPIVPLAIETRRLARSAIFKKGLARNKGAPNWQEGCVVEAEGKVLADLALQV